MKRLAFWTLIFMSFWSVPSYAIEGGTIALNENVVTFIARTGSSVPVCSGGLIDSRIVVTAKHCVDHGDRVGNINKNWKVTFPGTKVNASVLTAKILKIITTSGPFQDSNDDLAFVIIDKDFPMPNKIEILSVEDFERLRISSPKVLTYGYGRSRYYQLQSDVPYKIQNTLVENELERIHFNPQTFTVKYDSRTSYTCSGDSGGPNYIVQDGRWYLIGPTSAGSRDGCKDDLTGQYYLYGTAISYSLSLLNEVREELSLILNAENKAKANAQPAKVKTTITCVKGKLTKKVTAVTPKCPVGFKKK